MFVKALISGYLVSLLLSIVNGALKMQRIQIVHTKGLPESTVVTKKKNLLM